MNLFRTPHPVRSKINTDSCKPLRRRYLSLSLALSVALLLVAAVALAILAFPLTRYLLVLTSAHWFLRDLLESLAVDLELQPNLRWIFGLLVTLPISLGIVRMLSARVWRQAWAGLVLTAGTVLLVGGIAWWQTRQFNFDERGRPIVYVSFRSGGIHKSYTAGIDRVTGRSMSPITGDRLPWLEALARGPVQVINPAMTTNWFDPDSGYPRLWYVEVCSNRWEFFNRPVFHPRLQVEALPITRELMAAWEDQQQRASVREQAERQRRDEEALAKARLTERFRAREQAERDAMLRQRQAADAAARVEAERVRALHREEQAKREQEESRIREATAEQEAQERTRRQTAEQERFRLERRLREATARPAALELLHPPQFIQHLFPRLDAASFQPASFSEDYLGRRFRYDGVVARLSPHRHRAVLAGVSLGELHLVVQAVLQPGVAPLLKTGRPTTLAGTVVFLHLLPGSTNVNGIVGRVCLLELANAIVVPTGPKATSAGSATPRSDLAAKPKIGADPLFAPMSNFTDNSPVDAVVGFTIVNGTRLAFAPLRLLKPRRLDISSSFRPPPATPSPGSVPPQPTWPAQRFTP